MNAPDKLPPETRQPVSGYLWGALAVLTGLFVLAVTRLLRAFRGGS